MNYQNFICAVSMIVEKQNKILIAKRSSKDDFQPGIWEFPAGRVENDESLIVALKREAQEELGINIYNPSLIDAYTFITKNQKNLLLTYTCQTKDNPNISLEHDELKWIDPKDAYTLFTHDQQKNTLTLYIKSKP
ncbi:MAG: NUDIX domain-containing protein [Asgard group archaeon]|jgi:8-oxo-dGTP diphosphatase|nr:NUDIX domain-containing protein [Asgard group archaeon]